MILSLYCATSAADLIVTDPAEVAGTYIAYPIIYKHNFRNETIEGEMVLFNSTNVLANDLAASGHAPFATRDVIRHKF